MFTISQNSLFRGSLYQGLSVIDYGSSTLSYTPLNRICLTLVLDKEHCIPSEVNVKQVDASKPGISALSTMRSHLDFPLIQSLI